MDRNVMDTITMFNILIDTICAKKQIDHKYSRKY